MPYIKAHMRPNYDIAMAPLLRFIEENKVSSGELNYLVTSILLAIKPKKYDDMNAILGVLRCVSAEFERRILAPYEDRKIAENGDIKGFTGV